MKATRDGFGDQLVASAKENKNIVVLSADLAKATKVDKFAKEFPDRFFEVGIAENNMVGISSGMAENGFKVFLASFASFLTGKYDTIRCSLAYSNVPCVIVGTHVGMAIGRDGVTQMGLEDVSLMRSLPNMKILNPATYTEARHIVDYLCKTDLEGPHYLRLGRQPVWDPFMDEFYKFEFGKNMLIKKGEKGIVFSTGCILTDVLEATKDIDVTVINVHTLKPIDYESVKNWSFTYDHVFTIEDHSIIGGLGSAVAEIMAENGSRSVLTRIGLNDVFPESGAPSDLYDKYGLSSNKIREKILEVLNED